MNRIKECRARAGVSQKYIALTLGVSGPTVSEWETGKKNPSTKNVVELARLLGVSVEYLLGTSDDPGEAAPRLEALPAPAKPEPTPAMSAAEWEMVAIMRTLNASGIDYLLNTARMCAGNPAMRTESSAETETSFI